MDQLGAMNTIKRINSEIIGMIRYDLGVAYLVKTTLDKIDVKILSNLEKMKIKYRGTTRWRYYVPQESYGFGLRSVKAESLIELIKIYRSCINSIQVRKAYKFYDDMKAKKKRMKDQIVTLANDYNIEMQEIESIINDDEKDVSKEIMKLLNKFYEEKWKQLERS